MCAGKGWARLARWLLCWSGRAQADPPTNTARSIRTRPGSNLDRHSVPLQCGAKFVSRGELQFAEDAREVALNRACRDEQRLCDLAVSEALARVLVGGSACARPNQHNNHRARAVALVPPSVSSAVLNDTVALAKVDLLGLEFEPDFP